MSHLSISPSPMTFHFVQSSSRRIYHQKIFYIFVVYFSQTSVIKILSGLSPTLLQKTRSLEISVKGKYLIRFDHEKEKIRKSRTCRPWSSAQHVWSPWRRSRVEDPAAPPKPSFPCSGTRLVITSNFSVKLERAVVNILPPSSPWQCKEEGHPCSTWRCRASTRESLRECTLGLPLPWCTDRLPDRTVFGEHLVDVALFV